MVELLGDNLTRLFALIDEAYQRCDQPDNPRAVTDVLLSEMFDRIYTDKVIARALIRDGLEGLLQRFEEALADEDEDEQDNDKPTAAPCRITVHCGKGRVSGPASCCQLCDHVPSAEATLKMADWTRPKGPQDLIENLLQSGLRLLPPYL